MKKVLLVKLLSIVCAFFLLLGTTKVSATANTDEPGTTITCPEGDTYKCYTQGTLTVYKGKGATVITPAP
jgi:hypothetical protein